MEKVLTWLSVFQVQYEVFIDEKKNNYMRVSEILDFCFVRFTW